jgi:2-dehydro-3-deoxygluconokinase
VGNAPDVIVLGEVLVELASPLPLAEAESMRLSFSGDALNAAAAAAAAGAAVALVTNVGDDQLGERIVRFAAERGIDTSFIERRPEPNGIYFASADRGGERRFVYVRRGSAASMLGPADVARAPFADAGAVLVSGITQALSASCRAAVAEIVRVARGRVVYDPNFRAPLTSAHDARSAFREVAPHAALVLPSSPGDTVPLLDTDDPDAAVAAVLKMGAKAVAVSCGADGLVTHDGLRLPAPEPPSVVDATGAGDVLAGTAAARLALGDELQDALRLGVAAATLSLAGAGGTGRLATLAEARALSGLLQSPPP